MSTKYLEITLIFMEAEWFKVSTSQCEIAQNEACTGQTQLTTGCMRICSL
jgi:hypothetical protein